MYDDYRRLFIDRDPWSPPRDVVEEMNDTVQHLVFVRGRLVDCWREPVEGSDYHREAARLADELSVRQVVQPPPGPAHEVMLGWLESLVGGRAELCSLSVTPEPAPVLRDHLDPVMDQSWLLVDELLTDVAEALMSAELIAPLRRALLVLRDRHPEMVSRTSPERIAAGLVWVVGKANGVLGPQGPVIQKQVAEHLDSPSLSQCGQSVQGYVSRLGPTGARRPFASGLPDLLPTGRPELLSRPVRADLVRLRDDAMAVPPAEVA